MPSDRPSVAILMSIGSGLMLGVAASAVADIVGVGAFAVGFVCVLISLLIERQNPTASE